ncbi:hypothetical protein [Microcystis phage Mae-Yong1326-1]|nr:hypothetical protein [Microcystis phage Mae-Yong1326-1]
MCSPAIYQTMANAAGGDRANDLGVQWVARRQAANAANDLAAATEAGPPAGGIFQDTAPAGVNPALYDAPIGPAMPAARAAARPAPRMGAAGPVFAGEQPPAPMPPGMIPPQPADYAPPLPTTADFMPAGRRPAGPPVRESGPRINPRGNPRINPRQ